MQAENFELTPFTDDTKHSTKTQTSDLIFYHLMLYHLKYTLTTISFFCWSTGLNKREYPCSRVQVYGCYQRGTEVQLCNSSFEMLQSQAEKSLVYKREMFLFVSV